QSTYSADADHLTHLNNRLNYGRRLKCLVSDLFTNWTDDKMLTNGWSSDTVVGRARKNNQFPKDLIPCTSILYTWIDRGIMKTKNVDLLEKFHTNLEVILSKR